MDMKAEDRKKLINELTFDDLKALTDGQLRDCSRVLFDRGHGRCREKMIAALKPDLKNMAAALTSPPYVYMTPEIKIIAGCTARYVTLMEVQREDAFNQLNTFMREEQPTDVLLGDYLNKRLLVHSLAVVNGADFGGIHFDASDYQGLVKSKPEDARALLTTLRNERLAALNQMPPHVIQRLVENYQAFQTAIEELHVSEEMDETLGN